MMLEKQVMLSLLEKLFLFSFDWAMDDSREG